MPRMSLDDMLAGGESWLKYNRHLVIEAALRAATDEQLDTEVERRIHIYTERDRVRQRELERALAVPAPRWASWQPSEVERTAVELSELDRTHVQRLIGWVSQCWRALSRRMGRGRWRG